MVFKKKKRIWADLEFLSLSLSFWQINTVNKTFTLRLRIEKSHLLTDRIATPGDKIGCAQNHFLFFLYQDFFMWMTNLTCFPCKGTRYWSLFLVFWHLLCWDSLPSSLMTMIDLSIVFFLVQTLGHLSISILFDLCKLFGNCTSSLRLELST